mgnify:CR=1 FL=1
MDAVVGVHDLGNHRLVADALELGGGLTALLLGHARDEGPKAVAALLGVPLVCELNEGQLASYLRQQFQEFRFGQYNKCEGLPFTVVELKEEFNRILNEK